MFSAKNKEENIMSINTILFDLDGTLLPMDQDEFVRAYFKLLAVKLAPRGYEPQKLVESIWTGTAAMVKNDGSCTNEAAFWNKFAEIYGEKVREDEPVFQEYYEKEFQQAASVCGFTPKAAETIKALKEMGFRLVLATNPLFPAVATESRIRWAGLQPEDFELYTTYENSCHCKPNLDYYRDIIKTLALKPEACMMVGNDVDEDMVAGELGMKLFLLTDCLINKAGTDISRYPNGGFDELLAYVKGMREEKYGI